MISQEISARMLNRAPSFKFEDGVFCIEGIDYLSLIEEYGSPLVCFSRKRPISNIRAMRDVFRKYHQDTRIFYAYKANYLRPILSDIRSYAGAEVISGFELLLAENVGVKASDIIFNGVGKTNPELEHAVGNNILINVESLSEIERLDSIAKGFRKKARVGIRIHPYNDTEDGHYDCDKLGFGASEARKAIRKINNKKWLRLAGLNTHAYLRQTTPENHKQGLRSMLRLSNEIKHSYGTELEFFDIGGGFETRAVLERASSIDEFASELLDGIDLDNSSLYLEPGRYVVNDTAVVISKVVTKKTNGGRNWAITDISTNFLRRAANSSFFEVVPAEIKSTKAISQETISFGGRVGSSSDMIDENVKLLKIKEGDFVIVLNCGAYTVSMSEQFVDPRPAIIYIGSRGKTNVMWERETPEDLLDLYSGNGEHK